MDRKNKGGKDNLNYITRIRISFTIIIVMVLLCSGVTIYLTNSIAGRTTTLYDRPHTNLVKMWEIKARISETGSAIMSGYSRQEPLPEQARSDIQNLLGMIDAVESNKVDKSAPRSEAMQIIYDRESVWREEALRIAELLDAGKAAEITLEQLEEYRELEESFEESIDGIIVTAQANALNFRNTSVTLARTSITVLCVIFLVVILSAAASITSLTRRFNKPMAIVKDASARMTAGNLGEHAQYEKNDEFGSLIDDFGLMQEYLQRIVKEIERVVTRMGEGDFTVKTKEEFIGDFAPIETALQMILQNLSGLVSKIHTVSGQVSEGAMQLAGSAQGITDGSTRQAEEVEALHGTISQAGEIVQNTAQKARGAYEESLHISEEARQSGQEMEEMVEAMKNISDTSNRIANIIVEIEDIASQTNLLALNAAIEAARAGEAGRGFAVVADQIRKLAEDSATSAVKTRKLIETALEEVESGSRITESTQRTLQNVVEGVTGFADVVNEVNTMSVKQSEMMDVIGTGINQIAEAVRNNLKIAEETSSTSEELTAQAEEMNDLVKLFSVE